jgi:PAS domain S-box-containing protein
VEPRAEDPPYPLKTASERVAIYQSDDHGRCMYVNSVLCELFEISEQRALGIGWLDKVHPGDRERVQSARQHAISVIPIFQLDYRLQLSKGTIWVAAFSTALMDGPAFRGRIGTVIDITESKNLDVAPAGG